MKSVRVVSLVPSWTETLIHAGVEVIGRTRFCIHPSDKVSSIPIVGGTKNLNLQKLKELNADFVIVDKQENTLEMAQSIESLGIKLLVSNISDFRTVIDFIRSTSETLGSAEWLQIANRYDRVIAKLTSASKGDQIQAVLKVFIDEIVLGPKNDFQTFDPIDWVIWKKPFMVIGQNTFIADNLNLFRISLKRSEKYPTVTVEELKKSFCLFSLEPYPFAKDIETLKAEGFHGVLADGEKISWYGIRNLTFLERCAESLERS